jgi:exosome complex component RRP41
MSYTKRLDGRKFDELRPIKVELGVIKNADGSALFSFGDTIAIAAVYGPRTMHPQHMQDAKKGVLRVNYDMLSFSVPERKRPGTSRRSQEISKVTEWALAPVIDLEQYPNTVVDVFIQVIQANASTRCAGINAAAIALAHAGLPMKDMITAVSIGKIGDKIVADVNKDEEDYEEGATDIPIAMLHKNNDITLLQLDGKVSIDELKEAIEMAKKVGKEIYAKQKDILKGVKIK